MFYSMGSLAVENKSQKKAKHLIIFDQKLWKSVLQCKSEHDYDPFFCPIQFSRNSFEENSFALKLYMCFVMHSLVFTNA